MKCPPKLVFFSLSIIAAFGTFLWMRSLASWRPVKVGEIPPGESVYFLSSDAKTAFLSRGGQPSFFDVESGRHIQWPINNSSDSLEFSPHAPNWVFTLKLDKQNSVEVRDLATGHLKRTFRWPKSQFNSQSISDSDGNRVGIVEGDIFRQWNIATGQQLRQVQLDIYTLSGNSAHYVISPDGKRLVGYSDNRGIVCDTSSGKTIVSWKISSFGFPRFFSDDARVVAYTYISSTNVTPPIVFVDTSTGRVKWTASGNSSLYYHTGEEILLLGQRGCDILDVNTGRSMRHLPGPCKGDKVLRATPDYIYTLSAKSEILRWRAR